MITRLRLERFKGFREAELALGPFTLLVGANATGKSNIRDAFRFLHGVSRGYSLAEILGEKWVEGGVLQWRGIRGGAREAAFAGSDTFALEVSFVTGDERRRGIYRIEVNPGRKGRPPRLVAERLEMEPLGPFEFDLSATDRRERSGNVELAYAQVRQGLDGETQEVDFVSSRPILAQLAEPEWVHSSLRDMSRLAVRELAAMRFFDFSPEAMRQPSIPGQTVLSDRGENLSSVLQVICADPTRKGILVEWLQELTPMDATELEFPADLTGKVLVTLVDAGGQRTSAYSASDGTLRFLALLAVLLGHEAPEFCFFEELENGIHPTRLALLLQLIEQSVADGPLQVVASTHSPHLLGLLEDSSMEHVSFTYRLPNAPDARIRRLLDLPEASRLIRDQGAARLHGSGWIENVVDFLSGEEAA